MAEFQIVPDYFRIYRASGRTPRSRLSRALLNGSTIFMPGDRKTWGSLYTLAKNHSMICYTRRGFLHKAGTQEKEEGTFIWFDDPPKNAG